ncbi:MAG: hypothetical protein IKW21_00745 [Lachnospiraceae bacterium]|nr:hypothetical protein [Lachnospiraceae bacterium]
MNETARRYRKEMQKRVIVNLKKEDFERWSAYAAMKSVPVATMIRSAVEKEISEIEDSYETGIEDLITFQNDLKKG